MRRRLLVAAMLLGFLLLAPARARLLRGFGGGGVNGGVVNFPYTVSDNAGNAWFIYNDGAIRQQSGQPIFGQGGMLLIDGNNFSANNNTGTLDPKTGELLLENPQVGSVGVVRHIFIDKTSNFVRYIDVLHNAGSQEVTVNPQVQTSLNYGIQGSTMVADPKQKNANIGWVGMTPFGRAATEMYAGKGSKNVPQISSQQGNNIVTAAWTIKIPAGKDAAIMHLHTISPTVDAGSKFVTEMNESKLLHDIPPAIRRIIINFPTGQDWIGDVEILRGDIFDILELRGGDQLKGTLAETDYKLETFYGPVDLPVDRVVAMINIGQFRPRQLIVTSDGEIFGGRLDKETLGIALSSGQTVEVPLNQISRMGYRKRPDEPEEWTLDKPMVVMRTGDRVGVLMPTDKIAVNTRYGLLSLDPAAIAAILFQPEESGVHQIVMTDGSHFSGIVAVPAFQMKLSGMSTDQIVNFPSSAILRLQLAAKVADTDDSTPTMNLINDDTLCGSLSGQLKLDTTFDTLALDAAQIRHIGRGKENTSSDVQITLGDGTVVSGQLRDETIQCHLISGADVNVPVALIDEYNQPEPLPSPQTIEEIKKAVDDLSADDWHQRDRAQARLTALGPTVVGTLKQLRDQQPDEAKQRIDAILKSIDDASHPPAHPAAPVPANVDQ